MFALRWFFTSALLASVVSSAPTPQYGESVTDVVVENIQTIYESFTDLDQQMSYYDGTYESGEAIVISIYAIGRHFETAIANANYQDRGILPYDQANAVVNYLNYIVPVLQNISNGLVYSSPQMDSYVRNDVAQSLQALAFKVYDYERELTAILPYRAPDDAIRAFDDITGYLQNTASDVQGNNSGSGGEVGYI